jgi:hypothetical protein
MKNKIINSLKKKRNLKNPKEFLIFILVLIFGFGVVYASPALFTREGG